jgi:cardiolipin synthase A/B
MPEQAQADQTAALHQFEWLDTGHALLTAKLDAIRAAKKAIRLETFIFKDDETGQRFRQALIDAGQRGVKVRLLVDAIGGFELGADYFAELEALPHCRMKWFNRPSLKTWSFRDHRKLLIVDGRITFVGGCNIGDSYNGDGVTHGWRDGGMKVIGPVAKEVVAEFRKQWKRADLARWKLRNREQPGGTVQRQDCPEVKCLFINPGFGQNPLRALLREDLKRARQVCITSAYFLPSASLRRQLSSAAARGTKVRLLLGGKSDVWLMQMATRALYPRLLDAKIEVWEYQPQVLHSKILIVDDLLYVGSSNLDPRSLRINFEVMLRIQDARLAEHLRQVFERDLTRSERVTHEQAWNRPWWMLMKQRFARWFLGWLDPRVSEGMLHNLVKKP